MAISPESKMRSRDRVLTLEVIDDKKPKSLHGMIDVSNKLHAVADENTGLWSFKYERGVLPEALKCQFTSFKSLHAYANAYFPKRNLKVTEVLD